MSRASVDVPAASSQGTTDTNKPRPPALKENKTSKSTLSAAEVMRKTEHLVLTRLRAWFNRLVVVAVAAVLPAVVAPRAVVLLAAVVVAAAVLLVALRPHSSRSKFATKGTADSCCPLFFGSHSLRRKSR